jgi:hypothetical protein
MIFGSKDEAPPEGHAPESHAAEGNAAQGEAHSAAPADPHAATADAHAQPTDQHAAPAAKAEQPAAPAASHDAKAADHPVPVASDNHAGPAAVPAASATDKASAEPDASFFDSMKSMIFGAGEEPEAVHESASASPGPAPEPAPEPRTSAEGGKRWSASTDADAIRSDDGAAQTPHADGKSAPANGPTDADAAGAEWLAKFRAQQSAAASPTDREKPEGK